MKNKIIIGIIIVGVIAVCGYLWLWQPPTIPDVGVTPANNITNITLPDNRANETINVTIPSDNQTLQNNSAPVVERATVFREYPTVFQDITCWYGYHDPDGDEESGSIFRWFKNGVEQKDLTTKKVSSNYTSAGEIWKCEVTPSDGKVFGTPVNSTYVEILGVKITDGVPNQINVSLLWNKTFESEIVSVDLDSFPPSIVITRDDAIYSVIFLDERGSKIKQLSLNETPLWQKAEIVKSNKNNRRYVLIKSYMVGGEIMSLEHLGLYDDKRKFLWESNAWIDDERIIPPVPRYGSVVETGSEYLSRRNLYFYDENGNLIKKINTTDIFSLEHYNGSLFVIVVRKGYARFGPEGAAIDKMIAYDLLGNKLWEHKTNLGKIKISPNGKYILNYAWVANNSKIYTDTGQLFGEISHQYGARDVVVSQDNKFAVINTKYEIYMYEIETQELKWKYNLLNDFVDPTELGYIEEELKKDTAIIRVWAMDTSADGKFTVFGVCGGYGAGRENYIICKGYVRLLNNKGERIWQTRINTGPKPGLKISQDGEFITIYTKNNLYYFKINENFN